MLLNLIENQPDIDKIYLYVKGLYGPKYQYIINKREKVGINHFNDPKAFIEKLQYDIDRKAAEISALSSGKIHKYEYLTGEDILPSNQQQIIEQTKFTYSPLGKAFDKQIKTIEDHGKKQVDALENLKPKEETKPVEDKSNNQSRATIIFNELTNKRKDLMSELYDSVGYNNLKFEYIGSTKDAIVYEYMNSKELFNAMKNTLNLVR